jgi:hypothetical protein
MPLVHCDLLWRNNAITAGPIVTGKELPVLLFK